MTDTVFAQIVRGEIPADLVYQDELVTAFRDVQPQAPTHILVVPNKPVPTVADVTEAGYRLILNCRAHAGQEVFHVHLHLARWSPPRKDVVGSLKAAEEVQRAAFSVT